MSRIHILDDTEYVLTFLEDRLIGHDVYLYTQPEQFIGSIDSTVDVIITDLRVSRYDAIKNIRRFKEANIAVKIIVMSAYFNEEILLSLIDCHIYSAVKKTHEIEWMDKVVETVNK